MGVADQLPVPGHQHPREPVVDGHPACSDVGTASAPSVAASTTGSSSNTWSKLGNIRARCLDLDVSCGMLRQVANDREGHHRMSNGRVAAKRVRHKDPT